mmetsp:Transcript_22426/g.32250  ORF Transcript_22426/g.32250 Transcript_22426/m.32250 type:complete len:434 (+) Transcript_22426:388-1689(+)
MLRQLKFGNFNCFRTEVKVLLGCLIVLLALLHFIIHYQHHDEASLKQESDYIYGAQRSVKYGLFSEKGYLNVQMDIQILSDRLSTDHALQYAWNHYRKHGHYERRYIIIESNGRYYKGLISLHPDYYKMNNISSKLFHRNDIWSYYSKYGYYKQHIIGVSNFTEFTLNNESLTPADSYTIVEKHSFKPVILVLTHAWGGGTELFEEELLLSTQFDFIFFRIHWMMNLMQLRVYYGRKKVYQSYWVAPTREICKGFFNKLSYDLLLVDFLHPIPELMRHVKTINKPFIYTMHDHHAVKYDLDNDMHLGCSTTITTTDRYINYTNGMLPDTRHRWEFSEILRRAVLVTTPSLRNKELLSSYFPDITFLTAPNRPISADIRTIHVHRPRLISNDLLPSKSADSSMKEEEKNDNIVVRNIRNNQQTRQLKQTNWTID